MSDVHQLDSYTFNTLSLPYDKSTRDLDDTPRIVSGSNMLATYGGKLIKRPGTTAIANTSFTKRLDRLVVYETLETPAKIYLLASAFNASTGVWEFWYNRLDGPSPGWTQPAELRHEQHSTQAHEVAISRGLAYIKDFPSVASGGKFGTVVFDGSGSPGPHAMQYWGLIGPNVPARMGGVFTTLTALVNSGDTTFNVAANPGWPATPFISFIGDEAVTVTTVVSPSQLTVTRGSLGTTAAAHNNGAEILYENWAGTTQPITVNIGWSYVYAWETSTGQITCRSPQETNPDHRASNTGAFSNRCPKVDVQGFADTTLVPWIRIYRTTDGGGTWYYLGKVANTGVGTITVQDNFLTSNGGNLDPLPDAFLDTSNVAPDLTTNLPPPTVLKPLVLGTDTPQAATPIAFYSNRFWYAIGNVLFYSGQEEVLNGIPEECWPQGGLSENSYKFQHPVVNLVATGEALYVMTLKETFWIRGATKDTFQVAKLFGEIGAPTGHPRAAISVGNTVSWITHDFRVASARGTTIQILSNPLYNDIVTSLNANTKIELRYFAELDKEYLIVNLIDQATPTNCKQWFYDIRQSGDTPDKQFWNVPWDIRNSAIVSDRIRESDSRRRLCFYHWDGTNGQLAYWDSTEVVVRDAMPSGVRDYAHNVQFNLMSNPAGDHVNLLRKGAMTTVYQGCVVDRTIFASDTDPTINFFLDDLFSNPLTHDGSNSPNRRSQSTGYKTTVYNTWQTCGHVAIKISKSAVNERFELQGLALIYNPDAGSSV